MSNEMRTQGTELFVCTAATTVAKVTNIVNLGEVGKQSSDIDTSNLDSLAREFINGLADNGELTVEVNLDKLSPAHTFLSQNAGGTARPEFLIGFSDGTTAPTATGSVITPPASTSRSSLKFVAAIKSYRYNVGGTDSVVKASLTLRVSGGITETWKTS